MIDKLKRVYNKIFRSHYITLDDIDLKKIQMTQKNILKKMQKKDIINVFFFVSTLSKWKYDSVYRLFEKDKRFLVSILVVPIHAWGKEYMIKEMEATYRWFVSKKTYNLLKAYNYKKDIYIDAKKVLKPDIIFYSEPYNFVGKEYFITNFYNSAICCHVQYAFMTSGQFEIFYNKPFYNLLWKFFAETKIHAAYAERYMLNKGNNVDVTGYPGCDYFLNKNYKPNTSCWINTTLKQFKVIWAPHHTIDEEFGSSNFLEIYDYMKELSMQYKKKVFFVFKPHPNLKPRLYTHKNWGKEKTDSYYKFWESSSNTRLCEDDYVDLFLISDALIHDCGSFIVEYLYTKKPMLFLYKNTRFLEEKNDFGLRALEVAYKSIGANDIKNFIENILIKGDDYKQKERERFFNDYLLPPNGMSASENIYNIIKKELTK